ncbi:chemotaxis protein CheW [Paenibacillus cremeus]|nr:chemotaxis protein CheW [Paenibacillus cremeus]
MSQSFQSSYMGIFLDELGEQLQILDQMLLDLEQGGGQEKTIQTIFRAAHTLKGSSAAMGFEKTKELTHKLESIFDMLRGGGLDIHTSLINVLFQSVDHLKSQRESFLQGNLDEFSIDHMLAELEPFLTGDLKTQALIPESAMEQRGAVDQTEEMAAPGLLELFQHEDRIRIADALNLNKQVHLIDLTLEPDVQMPHARAMLLLERVRILGELIASEPTDIQLRQEYGSGLKLTLAAGSMDDIQRFVDELNQVFFYKQIIVEDLSADQLYHTQVHVPEIKPEAAPVLVKQAEPQPEVKAVVPEMKPLQASSQTVRVDVTRLEHLIDLVGELIIDQTRLKELGKQLRAKFRNETETELLDDILTHLNRVVGELQNGMMKVRMLPIEQLFNRIPRLVRDLSQQAGKEIEIYIDGKETELDRTLIEELSDPLIHILRNAADHGIEPPEERERLGKPRKGQIWLKAAHQENSIIITVTDDGRGISAERIKNKAIQKGFLSPEEAEKMSDREIISLIFHSGMSTAEQVTELSGRGVGMDIVRSHVEKIRGIIDIDTTPGEGTMFTIKLPLTLAIIRSLLVQSNGRSLAIPLVNVIEIFRMQADQFRTVSGRRVCLVRGDIVPLITLNQLLNQGSREEKSKDGSQFVVMIGIADKRVCLQVDRPLGNQEIVLKSLGGYVGQVPFITGSTILGDGIIREAGTLRLNVKEKQAIAKTAATESKLVTFLLEKEQYGIPVELIKEITPVPSITSMVHAEEHVLGCINLRGTLIPLYDLRQCLGKPKHVNASKSRVIVLELKEQLIGIMVDEVSEVMTIRSNEIDPLPEYSAKGGQHPVSGVHKSGDQLVMLLDITQAIQCSPQVDQVKGAMLTYG